MEFHTADLCDRFEDRVRSGQVRIAEPLFNSYGQHDAFHGRIATLKVFEDNSLVRKSLEQPGWGRVLVIDGGGSLRCALVGDQLASLGEKNGWAGILVYGCIRDSLAISEMEIGVLAVGTHPLKSIKKNVGEVDIPVSFAGVTFRAGEYLYADPDGVLVSPEALVAA